MSRRWWPWLWAMTLGLTACGGQNGRPGTATPAAYPTLDAAQVAQGRQIYQQHCAACHGGNAEGAPNWATPGPEGFSLPPPHDDSGHTWHHPDRVLHEVIRDGMSDPLRPGSPLRMPAFGDPLSEAEIRAVIEYFKSLWAAEHRQYQWEQTSKDVAPPPASP